MKRASIIAIVPVVVLLAAWSIPGASAQETPKPDAGAPASAAETPKPDAGTPAAAAETPQPPEIAEAVELFRQRDADGALKSLKNAYKKDPTLPPPQMMLAQLFASANLLTGMRNALEQGVKEYPADPQAYVVFADLAMRDRRITEARLLYEKADSLLPNFAVAKRKRDLQPQILAGLAMTSEARDDWAGAQKKIEAWLLLDPKSVPALEELAQCMLQQKNVTNALEVLVKACRIADDRAKAEKKTESDLLSPEATVAKFYARAGDQEKAKEWMKTMLNAKPRDIKNRLLASQWAFETGQLTEAEKQATAALQLDPNSLDGLVLRGVIARFQKNYKAAEDFCQKAHLLRPNLFAPSNDLALALVEQNDEEKKQRALEYAGANAQKYEKTAQAGEAYSTYGWVLYKLDRLDDAERALRAATSGGAFSADTAYYFARVLAKRGGHNKDAISLLESALRSTAPFAYRDDARRLVEELKK
jgi:tetratricopeptide (TPR) repeat protein